MKLPVALQLYSVRDEMAKDVKATLSEVKKMGYDGVESAGLFELTPKQFSSLCKDFGLIYMSAHNSLHELENQDIIKQFSDAGLKYSVIPYLELPEDYDSMVSNIEMFKSIGKNCKKEGLQLLYHNHDFEFNKINNEYILDTYFSSVSSEYLQTELDTCWVNVGGEDPVEYINKYKNKAPVVHLKDFTGAKNDNSFSFMPIGYGVQDIPSIIKAAESANTELLVVETDTPPQGMSAMECAKKSIEYLKSL